MASEGRPGRADHARPAAGALGQRFLGPAMEPRVSRFGAPVHFSTMPPAIRSGRREPDGVLVLRAASRAGDFGAGTRRIWTATFVFPDPGARRRSGAKHSRSPAWTAPRMARTIVRGPGCCRTGRAVVSPAVDGKRRPADGTRPRRDLK